jgi:CheY-like chemotaxis protein
MPKMDGMDLLDRIKKEDDKIKVCFFYSIRRVCF